MQQAATTPAPTARTAHIKDLIRRRYAKLSLADAFQPDAGANARAAGYPAAWLAALPARLAQSYSGCGGPVPTDALAGVRAVVDLGCGGGLDVRYLADRLGEGAMVIGLDLTPEVLVRARATGATAASARVVLVAGDMEALPLADATADLVTANAALNLALDKAATLGEAARILRPGGRLVAADLVRDGDLPPEILADPMAHATSLGGAVGEGELRDLVLAAGFEAVVIDGHRPFGPLTAVALRARKRVR